MNRWFQFAGLGLCCMICTGLTPGMAMFIEMLVEHGVGSSNCGKDAPSGCTEQYVAVASAFNIGGLLSSMGFLPAGLLFDRFGARALGTVGAGICVLGMFLTVIPVQGAAMGYDKYTASILPLALAITDAGAILNSNCLYGILWHFHDLQALVIAWMGASTQAGALLPQAFSILMSQTGCSLSQLLLGFTGFTALSCVFCYLYVPTLEEYRTQAEKVLGLPLPKPPTSMLTEMKKANAVLKVAAYDHMVYVVSLAAGFNFVGIFIGMLGEYEQLVFPDTPDAGLRLTAVASYIQCAVGVVFSPIFSYIADTISQGNSAKVMYTILLASSLVCTATIRSATWWSQVVCLTSCSVYICFVLISANSYCLPFSLASRIGTVMGLLYTYMVLIDFVFLGISYPLLDAMADQLPDALFYLSMFGTMLQILGYVRSFFAVQFDSPILLPGDEEELVQPLGCRNLLEVQYVLGLHKVEGGRTETLKRIVDIASMQEFMASIDPSRVERVMAMSKAPTDVSELPDDSTDDEEEPEVWPASLFHMPVTSKDHKLLPDGRIPITRLPLNNMFYAPKDRNLTPSGTPMGTPPDTSTMGKILQLLCAPLEMIEWTFSGSTEKQSKETPSPHAYFLDHPPTPRTSSRPDPIFPQELEDNGWNAATEPLIQQ